MTPKDRAVAALPANHQLGMRVPRGGSMCARCDYFDAPRQCGNHGFVRWNGGPRLPAPADQYCCDNYEIARHQMGALDGG